MGAVSDHSAGRQNHGHQCHVTEPGLFIDVHTAGDLAENYGCPTDALWCYLYPQQTLKTVTWAEKLVSNMSYSFNTELNKMDFNSQDCFKCLKYKYI